MLLEVDVEAMSASNPARLVSLYLMASYLYYCAEHHNPILSDNAYDLVCLKLARHWDDITHPHKHLIRLEDSRVSSNFTMREDDYPLIVRNAAYRLSRYPNELYR